VFSSSDKGKCRIEKSEMRSRIDWTYLVPRRRERVAITDERVDDDDDDDGCDDDEGCDDDDDGDDEADSSSLSTPQPLDKTPPVASDRHFPSAVANEKRTSASLSRSSQSLTH
jgi:hypothetical protein